MKSSNDWVILGFGNMVFDIIDAIKSNNQNVKMVVLNQDIINKPLLKKVEKITSVINISDFKVISDANYIFGFFDPNKQKFINLLGG